MNSPPHTSSRHARSKAERGSDTQASFRRYERFLVFAGPTCDDSWHVAVKELVQDANFECNEGGIVSKSCLSFVDRKDVIKFFAQNLQAMDNSHVALVSVKLEADGFALYRCDRPIPLGVNVGSLTKVLKCAKDDDRCTLKASDDADVLSLLYEAQRACTLQLSGTLLSH